MGQATGEKEWLSFLGFRDLAKWLLKTKTGFRFCDWFLRKHWKEVLRSEVGSLFTDYIASKVLGDNEHNFVPVVIEVHPDGALVVYGYGASVVIVNRLKGQSVQADLLSEQYASDKLRNRKHGEVYLDQRRILATGSIRCPTIQEELISIEKQKLLRQLDERIRESAEGRKASQTVGGVG